jgi:hypothetical protein
MGIETVALLAGAAVSAVGTGAAVYQGQKTARVAEKAADNQAEEAARQRNALIEKQKQEEASTAAKVARDRFKVNAMGGSKGGAVLSSPVGLPGLQSYSGQTYLGGGA